MNSLKIIKAIDFLKTNKNALNVVTMFYRGIFYKSMVTQGLKHKMQYMKDNIKMVAPKNHHLIHFEITMA